MKPQSMIVQKIAIDRMRAGHRQRDGRIRANVWSTNDRGRPIWYGVESEQPLCSASRQLERWSCTGPLSDQSELDAAGQLRHARQHQSPHGRRRHPRCSLLIQPTYLMSPGPWPGFFSLQIPAWCLDRQYPAIARQADGSQPAAITHPLGRLATRRRDLEIPCGTECLLACPCRS